MRIRSHNLLLIMPIFLGIAALNGALSYRGQLAEVRLGMVEGVESLAIVAAEFTDADLCRDTAAGSGDSVANAQRLALPLQRLMATDAGKQDMDHRQAVRQRPWIWAWQTCAQILGRPERSYVAWEGLRRLFLLAPDGERMLAGVGAAAGPVPNLSHVSAVAASGVNLSFRGGGAAAGGVVRGRLAAGETGDAAQLAAAIARQHVICTDPHDDGVGGMVLTAHAPVRDGNGVLRAIVGVEVDAASLDVHRGVIGLKMTVVSVGMLCLGGLAIWFVSGTISGQIRELNTAARAAAAGDYRRRVDVGTIQEVIDLGNTYNAMSSVLEEVVSRTKRELLDGEQFRTGSDLAREFSDLLWGPCHGVHHGVELVARLTSRHPTGDFMLDAVFGDAAYAVLGRVRDPVPLGAVARASAAATFIRQRLAAGMAPDAVAAELCSLLDVETLLLVRWRAGGREASSWSAASSGGELVAGTHAFQADEQLAFHTLGPQAGPRAEAYIALFAHLPAPQLMDDLTAVLGAQEGAVVVLRRMPTAGPHQPSDQE